MKASILLLLAFGALALAARAQDPIKVGEYASLTGMILHSDLLIRSMYAT